ncbi:MAG: murein biosynthesis integral membrane protein MurJ [Candidatus Comchoanobacterales bacterium]
MFKAIRSMSVAIFLSRILGLIRDKCSLLFLGSGAIHDAWLVAFRIPNFMRALFVEGAFSQAFIPILAQTDDQDQAAVVARVSGALSLLIALFCLPFYVAGHQCILIFVPGYADDPYQLNKVVQMLHWTMPYLWFIAMTGLLTAWLNCRGFFKWAARLPMLLNISLIAGCVILGYWGLDVVLIAQSVFIAGLLQLMIAWYLCWYYCHEMVVPIIDIHNATQRKIFASMGVASIGSSLVQISSLLDTWMGSWLNNGALTLLYIAQRLSYLPVGVFAVALTSVTLPRLSRAFASGEDADFCQLLQRMMSWMLMVSIPASLGLYLWQFNIVELIFGQGLTLDELNSASYCLGILAIGLPGFIAIKLLSSACFAIKRLKWPMVGVGLGITSYIATITVLGILQQPHVSHIAIGGVISAYINTLVLFVLLKHHYPISLRFNNVFWRAMFWGALSIWGCYKVGHLAIFQSFTIITWQYSLYLLLGILISVVCYALVLHKHQLLKQTYKEMNE